MLVLSRKDGDDILIGTDIRIKVLEVHKGCVKLGIDAPKELRITRTDYKEKPHDR